MKHLFARYTIFLWSLLKPLGFWGIFAVAFADAALIGIPVDPVVAGYIYSDPSRLWLLCLLAAAGSSLGSAIPYWAGRKGGEVFLAKRVSDKRLEELREKFSRHELFTIMLPAMLPPPAPLKLLVIAAGVFRVRFVNFLIAIFLGRTLRFLILSLLVLKFGHTIVTVAGGFLKTHVVGLVLLLIITGIIASFFLGRRWLSRQGA